LVITTLAIAIICLLFAKSKRWIVLIIFRSTTGWLIRPLPLIRFVQTALPISGGAGTMIALLFVDLDLFWKMASNGPLLRAFFIGQI